MTNELIFILHIIIISSSVLAALRLGKEALITLMSLLCILANLFVIKQTVLCGLHATTSDALAIGITLSLNMLQEYYGKPSARKAILISFAGALLYTLLSQIQLWYVPSCFDTSNQHFIALLSVMPRIMAASLITYLIVQILEYFLYAWLKSRINRYFVLRNYISIASMQLIDTILFSFLGLYGIVDHIGHIIIVSYSIKLIVLILATPWLWLSKKIMQ